MTMRICDSMLPIEFRATEPKRKSGQKRPLYTLTQPKEENRFSGRPVSRILSGGGQSAWAIICLDRTSPHGSSSLPGANSSKGEATSSLLPAKRASPLLGFAPSGGCLAAHITAGAGSLLHHLFTLTSHAGGMSLWPDPASSLPASSFPVPGVTRHCALWSADFPRPQQIEAAIARPT